MRRKIILILLISSILTALLLYMDRQKRVQTIERNGYGEGARTEAFRIFVDGEELDESLKVEIEEEAYAEEELQEVFGQIMDKLDILVLGENESFDRVETDLQFVSEVEGYPITIRWQLDSYSVLGPDGSVQTENTVENGTLVEICGILSYGEREAMYIRTANVYPETKTGQAAVLAKIEGLFAKQEEETREEETVFLPTTVDGKEIRWEIPADRRGYMILLLGVTMAVLLPAQKKQKENERRKRRQEELLTDYPKMIGTFTLLLETGMTVKQVWMKIVKQYEDNPNITGKREVYEEMRETYYEMQSGITETEAYERFGARCGLSEYRKFAALLSQNLRKGTKGIAQLLYMESLEATENRKSRAKRKAEEAGTKLLIPMFVMLCIVIVIIMVPAFLSMQL